MVRQDLRREMGIKVSLRTVERAVRHLRREVLAQKLATVRFETAPGEQLQIDFGSLSVQIGGESRKIYLFVATLGYSRRTFVDLFLHERQSAWMHGLEGAFRHFGGTTRDVLMDNAKALVHKHNVQTREIVFNERFASFCRYWAVIPRACAPYRARTKGKDERGVGYVKRNAIAGHTFTSLDALRSHLSHWMREVADVRVHGTTGEPPPRALRARGARRAAPHQRSFAVPAGTGARALRSQRCVHRAGYQPLQRSVETDRGEPHGRGRRAPGAHAVCRERSGLSPAEPLSPHQHHRSATSGGDRRRVANVHEGHPP